MQLPKSDFNIKIGPFMYEVKFSKEVTYEGGCYGCVHNATQTIYIDPELKDQKKEQTFIHETLHACMFVSELSYQMEHKKTNEEDVVRSLSMIFYQFIKDNPFLFKKDT